MSEIISSEKNEEQKINIKNGLMVLDVVWKHYVLEEEDVKNWSDTQLEWLLKAAKIKVTEYYGPKQPEEEKELKKELTQAGLSGSQLRVYSIRSNVLLNMVNGNGNISDDIFKELTEAGLKRVGKNKNLPEEPGSRKMLERSEHFVPRERSLVFPEPFELH